MNFTRMSLEELEDQDRQLRRHQDIDEATLYRQRIDLYSAMWSHYKRMGRLNEDDQSLFDDITERLVFNLIHYGTYMKMADLKDDHLAIKSLERALRYQPENPIAAYRLGFLFYRRKNYVNALTYFNMAIRNQKLNKTKDSLSERQITHAHTYLTNSALHIAKQTQDNLKKLLVTENEKLPGYEFSVLFDELQENERHLEKHSFYKETPNGRTTCSKAECESLAEKTPPNTLVLYFGDSETSVSFNRRSQTLTKRESELFRLLLIDSSAENPANAKDVKSVFSDDHAFVPSWETYRQACRRLRTKISEVPFPNVINTVSGSHAYYFNGSLSYIILYRVDV